jgi:hypothetical protein
MWVFLNNSFLSIVADKNGTFDLIVRARVKGDIERVFPGVKVTRTPNRDYLFRAFVDRETVANAISEAVLDISYDNFKDSVKETRRKQHYSRVWWEMSNIQSNNRRQHVKKTNLFQDRSVSHHFDAE